MSAPSDTFSARGEGRWHWLMALLILGMLFVGLRMEATESPLYGPFVAWHRPIGIAILVLVAVRLAYRLVRPPPAAAGRSAGPSRSSGQSCRIGRSMGPDVRHAAGRLGPCCRRRASRSSSTARSNCRRSCRTTRCSMPGCAGLHTALAYLLILTFLAHFGAALFHWLVRRDGVFESMGFGRKPAG